MLPSQGDQKSALWEQHLVLVSHEEGLVIKDSVLCSKSLRVYLQPKARLSPASLEFDITTLLLAYVHLMGC